MTGRAASAAFERRVEVHPAWDHGPGKGRGSASMRFVLIGERGAVGLLISTGWGTDLAVREPMPDRTLVPRGREVSTHLFCPPVRLVEAEECCYSPTGHCVAETGYLTSAADALLRTLILGGDDDLWRELEGWYREKVLGRPAVEAA